MILPIFLAHAHHTPAVSSFMSSKLPSDTSFATRIYHLPASASGMQGWRGEENFVSRNSFPWPAIPRKCSPCFQAGVKLALVTRWPFRRTEISLCIVCAQRASTKSCAHISVRFPPPSVSLLLCYRSWYRDFRFLNFLKESA